MNIQKDRIEEIFKDENKDGTPDIIENKAKSEHLKWGPHYAIPKSIKPDFNTGFTVDTLKKVLVILAILYVIVRTIFKLSYK